MSIGAAYATGGADLSDSVLGVKIIDGRADLLNFGGQVMKNVAGYDVARLLVGSQGKLALITQISMRVWPKSYVDDAKLMPKTNKTTTALQQKISQNLKNAFDPQGVFI